jgi:hypothetical protein
MSWQALCSPSFQISYFSLNTILKQFELDHIMNMDNYKRSASYCRKFVGFEYLFTKFELFIYIKLIKYYKEQDIEACVLKLEFTFFNIFEITIFNIFVIIYRAPSGDFSLFLNRLDRILNSLYKVDLKFIICGGINYLTDSDGKKKLDAVLLSYYLSSIANFPPRTQNESSTAIDNINLYLYHYRLYCFSFN